MSQVSTSLKPGAVFQDSYRIERLLGEGGMGATYAGLNLATGHEVAIKVMTPAFARNTKAAELFRREANLMRTLRNDAIVGFETSLLDKTGQMVLVMEFIKGKPLAYFLERKARLAPIDVLKLARRLLDGLAAIHRLGIVHRDISPDNIMIPEHDILAAKLIDFGVASDTIGTDKTLIGQSFAGKISYAAPEQLGVGTAQVSAASDLYSLGLVLLRTAGQEVPGLGAKLADAIDARRHDIKLSSADLPEPLRQVLEAMLRAEPTRRPREPLVLVERAIEELNAMPVAGYAEAPRRIAAQIGSADLFDGEEDRGDQAGQGGSNRKRVLPLAGGALVFVLVLAGLIFWGVGTGGLSGSKAGWQAAIAKQAAASGDPLSEIEALVDAGGEDNLNAAFGALMALSQDEGLADRVRALAAVEIARMYDPLTYDKARSPFPAANPKAAKRFYHLAIEFGSSEALTALARLTQ